MQLVVAIATAVIAVVAVLEYVNRKVRAKTSEGAWEVPVTAGTSRPFDFWLLRVPTIYFPLAFVKITVAFR